MKEAGEDYKRCETCGSEGRGSGVLGADNRERDTHTTAACRQLKEEEE